MNSQMGEMRAEHLSGEPALIHYDKALGTQLSEVGAVYRKERSEIRRMLGCQPRKTYALGIF